MQQTRHKLFNEKLKHHLSVLDDVPGGEKGTDDGFLHSGPNSILQHVADASFTRKKQYCIIIMFTKKPIQISVTD